MTRINTHRYPAVGFYYFSVLIQKRQKNVEKINSSFCASFAQTGI